MSIQRIILMAILWVCVHAHGQNRQLLYDFGEVPQSLMVNPGTKADFNWFAGIPLFSKVSVQMGTNGISAQDIFADDGLSINDKIRDRALGRMDPNDELSGTYQLELFSGGFRGKNPNNFYSFGIYHEGDAIGYWFQDFAELAIEGNADKLGQRFDMSHLNTRGEMMNVFHFGVNKRMRNGLFLGARGKIYSSIFDFNSTRNSGYFVTTEGEQNLLSSTLNADMQLRTSGLNAINTAEDNGTLASTVMKRGFFGGNYGVGVDVGFSYNVSEKLVVTGSLLDLGFIYHFNDVKSYSLKGDATTEGVEIILPSALSNAGRDFWQDFVDDIEAMIPFEEESQSYIAFRPTKFYGSLRYDFGKSVRGQADCDCDYRRSSQKGSLKYANGAGVQVYMINRPKGPQAAFTAFYQRRFGDFMSVKTTYTADKFSRSNIGLGLSMQAGPVNLYFMADNLLGYKNLAETHYASFQLGLNIISWGTN